MDAKSTDMQAEVARWMTRKEGMFRLGVGANTIVRWANRGWIRRKRINKRVVLYDLSHTPLTRCPYCKHQLPIPIIEAQMKGKV